MASGSAVTLDKVTIQIQAASKDANTNIRDLSKTLRELKEATKGGFNNLSKLATSLKELNKASKGVPAIVENLGSVKKITNALSKLSSIPTPTGLKSTISNLEKLPATFSRIDTNTIDNVAKVSSALSNSLDPLANKLGMISNGLSSLSTLAKNYGVSITKLARDTKKTSSETSKLNKALTLVKRGFSYLKSGTVSFGDKTLAPLKKLNSKIKQIGLSLLGTRTIFTMTRKAVSEYMAMDQQLTDSLQNTWRAFGAQLAPAVEYVMYLFKQFVRVIYSIVYALTGIDLIARANAKALAAMNKSAKDALGSLQKFDDLNVAEFDKGSGDITQIELDKIDLTPIQEVIDWMREMKAAIETAWKTGQWTGVAEVLAKGINGAIDAIDPNKVGNTITNIVTGVLDFISTTIGNIDWSVLGTKIRESIENIDWKQVWTSIKETALEILGGLKDFIKGLFNLDEQDWDGLVTAIVAVGTALITYKILDTFNSLVISLETIGLLGSAGGATTLGLMTIAKWMGVIALVAGGITLGIQGIIDLFDGKIWDGIQKILVGIALILGAIALAVGSMPILIAAVVAVIIAMIVKIVQEIVENWDKIKKVLGKIGDWINKYVIQPIVDNWNRFVKLLKMAWDIVVDNWNKFWSNMWNGCKKVINWIIGGVENMINFMIRGINGLSSGLRKIGNKIFDIIGIDITFNPISEVKLPRLETGTNEVPYEGIYHLHEGEAVVPKKYNPALGNGTNEETNEKLDTLINIMQNMNFTNIVNVGNETLYKKQQSYNKKQNDKYGTTVNL